MVKNPRIILIGGASYIGKSTLGLKLGCKLNIRQIVDIDVIREILRGERSKTKNPYLYYCSTTAWRYRNNNSDVETISSFIKYSEELQSSIKRIIERAYELGKDTIIEGVHIIPSFFKEYSGRKNFYIIILDCEEKNHLKNIGDRKEEFGKNAERFYDRFPRARVVQDFLLQDATINNVPIVTNFELDNTLNKILKVIK